MLLQLRVIPDFKSEFLRVDRPSHTFICCCVAQEYRKTGVRKNGKEEESPNTRYITK